MLCKSRRTFDYVIDGRYVLFNSQTLKLFVVDNEYIDVLNREKRNPIIEKELISEGFLIDDSIVEDTSCEKQKRYSQENCAPSQSVGYLRVSLTENCNLSCKYCFVQEEFYNKGNMNIEYFTKVIEEYISHNRGNEVIIQYFGGEPLLRMDLIRTGNTMLKLAVDSNSILVANQEIVSNGTLLDYSKIDYFKENNIRLTISLDGPRELNDINRIYSDGKGSFDDATKWSSILLKELGYFSVLLTPNGDNIDKIFDSIKYLVENLGTTEVSVNTPQPCLEGWEIDGELLADEIKKTISYCKDKNVLFSHPASNMLYLLKHRKWQTKSCIDFSENSQINTYGVYVSSGGLVSRCLVKKEDIRFQGFDSILERILEENWVSTPSACSKCLDCELTNVCCGACSMEQKVCKDGYNAEKCKFMKNMFRWVLNNATLSAFTNNNVK